MVRVIDIDGVRTVYLLGKQHAHHPMWQSQTGEANQAIALRFELRLQTIRPADDANDVVMLGLPML